MSVDAINTTGGAGKAVASAFVPGLGQMLDDKKGKGALYLGGTTALAAGSKLLADTYLYGKPIDLFASTWAKKQQLEENFQLLNNRIIQLRKVFAASDGFKEGIKNVQKANVNLMNKASEMGFEHMYTKYAAIGLGLAAAGLWIANIVDAYKGNKNK